MLKTISWNWLGCFALKLPWKSTSIGFWYIKPPVVKGEYKAWRSDRRTNRQVQNYIPRLHGDNVRTLAQKWNVIVFNAAMSARWGFEVNVSVLNSIWHFTFSRQPLFYNKFESACSQESVVAEDLACIPNKYCQAVIVRLRDLLTKRWWLWVELTNRRLEKTTKVQNPCFKGNNKLPMYG